VFEPLEPTLTPGETLAPTLRSLLVTFTLASTPTFGFTFVDPPTEPVVVPVEPLVAPMLDPDEEPVVVPVVDPVVAPVVDPVVEPVVELAEPVVEPVVEPLAEPMPFAVPAEAESAMQSWWTGLAECSLAWPVDLSASLPAFGWLSSLQSGVVDDDDAVPLVPMRSPLFLAVSARDVALWVGLDSASLAFADEVCANAGAVPRSAAIASVLRYVDRIMLCLLYLSRKEKWRALW